MCGNFALRIWLALASLCTFTGCDWGSHRNNQLDVKTMREQVKSNLIAAFEAVEKETARATSNPIFKTSLPKSKHSVGQKNVFAKIVSQLADGPVVQELFAEENIAEHNYDAVIYDLKSTLCHKLNDLSNLCQTLLEKNRFQLKVKSLGNKGFDLTLLIAEQGNAPIEISTTTTSPNMLSQSLNFVTLHRSDSGAANAVLSQFLQSTGAISWTLRFDAEGSKSNCESDAPLCFSLNVDEDIEIESDKNYPFNLKWNASPQNHPTLSLSSNQNNTLSMRVNIGEVAGQISERDGFFFSGASFTLTFGDTSDNPDVLIIENLQMGNKSSWFRSLGKKIILDLKQPQDGTLTFLKIWRQANAILTQISPFDLALTFSHENSTHSTNESIRIVNDQTSMMQVKWNQGNNVDDESNDIQSDSPEDLESVENANRGEANELLIFAPLKFLEVADECKSDSLLFLSDGALRISYDYRIGEKSEHLLLQINKNQCLRCLPMKFIGRVFQHGSKTWQKRIFKTTHYLNLNPFKSILAWLDKANNNKTAN